MTEEVIKLEVQTRTDKENPKDLIKNGLVPAILYGKHLKENVSLKVDLNHFIKIFRVSGESTLIDIILDGKDTKKKAIIKDTQKNPIKNSFIHIDLYEVDMNEPIHATIQLRFIGESNAVKNMGGSLIMNMDEIEVKCLPSVLVNHIDVDISKLNEFGDTVNIKDLAIPTGMEVLHESEETVAIVVEPKEEEEIPVAEVAPTEGTAAATDQKAPETPEAPAK